MTDFLYEEPKSDLLWHRVQDETGSPGRVLLSFPLISYKEVAVLSLQVAMSSLNSTALPKPRNWQDFEKQVRELFACELNDPNTQMHGRTGQPQRGVDVYCPGPHTVLPYNDI